jgi:hypothetical protein
MEYRVDCRTQKDFDSAVGKAAREYLNEGKAPDIEEVDPEGRIVRIITIESIRVEHGPFGDEE